jgi:hypothetical protein
MLSRTTALLAATGLTYAAAEACSRDVSVMTASDRYTQVATHLGLERLSAALFMVCSVLIVASVFALARHAVTGRGSRLIDVGALMFGAGAAWVAAGRAAWNLELVTLLGHGVPHQVGILLVDASPGWAWVAFDGSLLLFLVGPVLMTVGVARAGLTSWLPLVVYVVGAVLSAALEFHSGLGATVGAVAIGIAWTLIGHALSQRQDTQPSPATRTEAATA